MPAPADEPRLIPMLSPSALTATFSADAEARTSSKSAACSSGLSSPRSLAWRVGTTIRCPDAKGYLLSITKASRRTQSTSRSAKRAGSSEG